MTGGRNFTNKLWNAARFVLRARPEPLAEPSGEPALAARWIGSRLAGATERATRQLDELDLAGYAATVYEVAWSDYCDWFLEMAKVELRREDATDADRAATWWAAADGLATLLRLLHPLMPFVTEEIWPALGDRAARYRWRAAADPRALAGAGGVGSQAEAEFDDLSTLVRGVRNLRTAAGVPAGAWVPLVVAPPMPASAAALEAARRTSKHSRGCGRSRCAPGERPTLVAATPLGAAWLGVVGAATRRAGRQRAELEATSSAYGAAGQQRFVSRAPAAVVEGERERLAELEDQLASWAERRDRRGAQRRWQCAQTSFDAQQTSADSSEPMQR